MTNSARERIADIIATDLSRDSELWNHNAKYEQADLIIAIVRDELLSEAAVEAAREAIEYRSVEPRSATSDQELTDDALDALEAAWLTAFDADDT